MQVAQFRVDAFVFKNIRKITFQSYMMTMSSQKSSLDKGCPENPRDCVKTLGVSRTPTGYCSRYQTLVKQRRDFTQRHTAAHSFASVWQWNRPFTQSRSVAGHPASCPATPLIGDLSDIMIVRRTTTPKMSLIYNLPTDRPRKSGTPTANALDEDGARVLAWKRA